MFEIESTSVAGGWQTSLQHTQVTFGPVFNKITDLWAWQKKELFWPVAKKTMLLPDTDVEEVSV